MRNEQFSWEIFWFFSSFFLIIESLHNNCGFRREVLADNGLIYCWAANFFFKDSGISGGGGLGNLKATLTPS